MHLFLFTVHFFALTFLHSPNVPVMVTGQRPSIPPRPDFAIVCRVAPASRLCQNTIIQAINHARAKEGLGPIALPADFLSEPPVQQLFALANAERVSRGLLPAIALKSALNRAASASAPDNRDPQLPAGALNGTAYRWTGNWAQTYSPLAADYYWMYDDGWAGAATFNVDVTGPDSQSAWDHRNNILLPTLPGQHLVMGAAAYPQSQPFQTFTELFLAQG